MCDCETLNKFPLSTRAKNAIMACLKEKNIKTGLLFSGHIKTFEVACFLDKKTLLSLRNVGKKTVDEIVFTYALFGYHLPETDNE